MRFLTPAEVLELHHRIIQRTGGALGLRDGGALQAALAQPFMTFGGHELHPTLTDKAAALGFFLISDHPFTDGNKRVGHAAMETFLLLNGYEIVASVDEQEQVILAVASGAMEKGRFTEWLKGHVVELTPKE